MYYLYQENDRLILTNKVQSRESYLPVDIDNFNPKDLAEYLNTRSDIRQLELQGSKLFDQGIVKAILNGPTMIQHITKLIINIPSPLKALKEITTLERLEYLSMPGKFLNTKIAELIIENPILSELKSIAIGYSNEDDSQREYSKENIIAILEDRENDNAKCYEEKAKRREEQNAKELKLYRYLKYGDIKEYKKKVIDEKAIEAFRNEYTDSADAAIMLSTSCPKLENIYISLNQSEMPYSKGQIKLFEKCVEKDEYGKDKLDLLKSLVNSPLPIFDKLKAMSKAGILDDGEKIKQHVFELFKNWSNYHAQNLAKYFFENSKYKVVFTPEDAASLLEHGKYTPFSREKWLEYLRDKGIVTEIFCKEELKLLEVEETISKFLELSLELGEIESDKPKINESQDTNIDFSISDNRDPLGELPQETA